MATFPTGPRALTINGCRIDHPEKMRKMNNISTRKELHRKTIQKSYKGREIM